MNSFEEKMKTRGSRSKSIGEKLRWEDNNQREEQQVRWERSRKKR
jgi:hypothetical protein